MIIEFAYMLGATGAALILGAVVAKGLLNRGFVGNTFTQLAFGGIIGLVLVTMEVLTMPMVGAVVTGVIASKVATILYFWRISKGALGGKYGQETKWVAEMIKEDDEEFKRALNHLTDTDRREIRIIAESKDELREEVIERAEQNT